MRQIFKIKNTLKLILPLILFFFLLCPLGPLEAQGGKIDPIDPQADASPIVTTPTGSNSPASSGNLSGSNRVLDRMNNIAFIGGYKTGSGATTIPKIVGMIINTLLSVTGLIFIVLTVFAGFNWMTSQGNDEKIKKSQDSLKSSVIGLIVTLSAWTIWNFIFTNLIL